MFGAVGHSLGTLAVHRAIGCYDVCICVLLDCFYIRCWRIASSSTFRIMQLSFSMFSSAMVVLDVVGVSRFVCWVREIVCSCVLGRVKLCAVGPLDG